MSKPELPSASSLATQLEQGMARLDNQAARRLRIMQTELDRLAVVEQENSNLLAANKYTSDLLNQALKELADIKASMGEPAADLIISDDDFNLGFTDVYAMGTKRLENGKYDLYAKAKP